MQSDFARAGEGDIARLGMGDDGVSEAGAGTGTKIYYAFGHAGFFEKLDELGGDGGGIARRLEDDRVAADDGSHRHAGHDCAREIPRRNHRAHTQRDVGQRIALARQLHWRFSFGETQGFAGVELAEVDGLRDVGVGLAPVLADLEDQPSHVVHFALAHQVGGAEQQAGALFDGSAAPGFEGSERRGHGRLDVLFAGFLMDADHLRRAGRVQRLDLVGGFDALAADD